MATLGGILKAIRETELTDSDLAEIAHVAFKKRQALAMAKSKALDIGDAVQLTRIKPKYMEGETGILMERRGGKLLIKLDYPNGRFKDTVLCHPTCVEPLDA